MCRVTMCPTSTPSMTAPGSWRDIDRCSLNHSRRDRSVWWHSSEPQRGIFITEIPGWYEDHVLWAHKNAHWLWAEEPSTDLRCHQNCWQNWGIPGTHQQTPEVNYLLEDIEGRHFQASTNTNKSFEYLRDDFKGEKCLLSKPRRCKQFNSQGCLKLLMVLVSRHSGI